MCVGVPCGFHRGLVRSRGRWAVAGWGPVREVKIMTRRNEAVTMSYDLQFTYAFKIV